MTKRLRGFQKIAGGFKWSRHGFVKLPDRLRTVSIKPQPLRAKNAAQLTPKKRRQPENRLGVKRPEKAKEQGGEVAAPESTTPTTRQPRSAWSGKYDGLTERPS